MASFKRTVKTNMEALAEAPKSGNAIPTSGVYDITLKAVWIDVAPWGDQQLSMLIEANGSQKTLFSCLNLGPESTNGLEKWKLEAIEKAWSVFDHLAIVCGVNPEDITDTETTALPIGKEGSDVDCECFTEFEDKDIKAWIKQEFYVSKKGDIGESLVLKEVFDTNGFSGDEILREEETPVRIEKLAKYTEAVGYKNDLTEEAVQAWVDAGRPKGTGAASAATTTTTKRPSFGRKK